MKDGCPFCEYDGPSMVFQAWGDRPPLMPDEEWDSWEDVNAYVIEPINPVTDGHFLVIPVEHVEDFRDDPEVLAQTMGCAAVFATERFPDLACNLIVSAGREATQTVMHLHVHVIPRREGDDLKLPWSAK